MPINARNLKQNLQQIAQIRNAFSAGIGVAAGILGLRIGSVDSDSFNQNNHHYPIGNISDLFTGNAIKHLADFGTSINWILTANKFSGVIFYFFWSMILSIILWFVYGGLSSKSSLSSSSSSSSSHKTTGTKLYRHVLNQRAYLTDGILGNILSFVLFWTLFYGIVHVYD